MITEHPRIQLQGEGYGPPGGGWSPGEPPAGGSAPGNPGGWGPQGPPGYGAPPGLPGVPAPPLGRPNAAETKKQAELWLIISGATFLLCGSWCFGIAGAVFCYLAIQAASQGNLDDAEAKLKWGKIITVSGTVLGVLAAAVYLLLSFAF